MGKVHHVLLRLSVVRGRITSGEYWAFFVYKTGAVIRTL